MTRHLRAAAPVLSVAVLAAACGGGEDAPRPGAGGTGPAAGVTWPGPPPAAETDGELSVAEFNALAESGERGWERSAFGTVAEYVGLDRAEAATTTLVVETPPERGRQATAVATLAGLLDDSVESLRYTVELTRRDDGTWVLLRARREQRCRPERGQQDFDARPCL